MKRVLCLVLCLLTAALCCACGENNLPTENGDDASPTTAPAATADTAKPTSGAADDAKIFMADFDDTPTVGDKVIYVDSNMTVTVHGINYAPIAGPELHLTIANNFGKDITVQAPYVIVNGYMLTPELGIDVPNDKTKSGNMTLRYSALAYANITCIRTIEFALRIVETKNYTPFFTTELITLKTSAAATPEERVKAKTPVGQTAYDDKDIRILFTTPAYGAERSGDAFTPIYTTDGDALLLVYIENNTDRSVAVRTDDVTVNGCDLTSVMNRTVLPGKRAVDTVTFYRMDLDEFDIDAIDSIKMSFQIKDAETWETIDSTDMIAVKLQDTEEETTGTKTN